MNYFSAPSVPSAALVKVAVALVILSAPSASAQVTSADYQRAQGLRQQYEAAAVMVPDTPAVRALTCTYHPTVRGVASKNFTARRQ